MARNIQLDVVTRRNGTLQIRAGRHRTVAEVLDALSAVAGRGERLELYYGNSKLKPDYTLEFFLQAYGASRTGAVALRLEEFEREGDAPPRPGEEEVVLLEQSVGPRLPEPPPAQPAAPASRPTRGTARRPREGERSFRIRIERPLVLRTGTTHCLRVGVRALSALPTTRTLTVEPRFPGCLVSPERVAQPACGERTHEFQITPLAAGSLKAAVLRFSPDDRPAVDVAVPASARNGIYGRVLPLVGVLVAAIERLQPTALLAAAALAIAGAGFLVWSRPRYEEPREETVVL